MKEYQNAVKELFNQSIKVKQAVLKDEKLIETLVEMAVCVANAVENGGKLMICGNGGSAADAQHLAAELSIRLRSEVNRQAIPAIPLAMDSSSLTACGNDFGYEYCYSRMLEALGKKEDVLLGITTSGKSPNVVKALEEAKKMGIKTMGFLGGTAQPALDLCDIAFVAPSLLTGRVQETHITAGHVLLEMVEDMLLEKGCISKL
ncbi:MAG: SIS domain-containing protein [Alphaproteobacteria bacterium]|nr:SIS domain-containing protein [Alphaproteobacteria bacterium]